MRKLLIHTASLYYWFTPYEDHLDDRIHAALDAGFDGVEISNGSSILNWTPRPETIRRLKNKLVTLHAEFSTFLHLPELIRLIETFPFNLSNIVIHPDELTPREFERLKFIQAPISLENLDGRATGWNDPQVLNKHLRGLRLCYDTAHAMETGANFSDFASSPIETHLSLPNSPQNHYANFGWETRHAMTQFEPDNWPAVPSACPLIVSEGLAPVDPYLLRGEREFIQWHLD